MHLDPVFLRPKFRVLSLDGGGIRGVFTAAFLAELESHLDAPIGSYFDLIAGTSTGGIIALGLAAGHPASEIRDLYVSNAEKIFTERGQHWGIGLAGRVLGIKWPQVRAFVSEVGVYRSKYHQEGLRNALRDKFGDRTIEDLATCRVVVPAVDLVSARTIVFKTPHLPGLVRDRQFSLIDVALATSAAPTYFPHAIIEAGSAYADGGLWANNPAIVAYAETARIREQCTRDEDPQFEFAEMGMLSVGTGRIPHCGVPGRDDTGFLWWGARLLDAIGLTQSMGYHHEAAYLMGDHYLRVDFDLPDSAWQLDNIDVIQELIHLGREAARQQDATVRQRFLFEPAPDYRPYPLP